MTDDPRDLVATARRILIHLGYERVMEDNGPTQEAQHTKEYFDPNRDLEELLNFLSSVLKDHPDRDAIIVEAAARWRCKTPQDASGATDPAQTTEPDAPDNGSMSMRQTIPLMPTPSNGDVLTYTMAELCRSVLVTLHYADGQDLDAHQIARFIALQNGQTDREAKLLTPKVSTALSYQKTQLRPPHVMSKGPRNRQRYRMTEAGKAALGLYSPNKARE